MEIIENKALSKLLGTIGVDKENGTIVSVSEDEVVTDITNSILELVVLAIEDNQSFVLWNRIINIRVSEIED